MLDAEGYLVPQVEAKNLHYAQEQLKITLVNDTCVVSLTCQGIKEEVIDIPENFRAVG